MQAAATPVEQEEPAATPEEPEEPEEPEARPEEPAQPAAHRSCEADPAARNAGRAPGRPKAAAQETRTTHRMRHPPAHHERPGPTGSEIANRATHPGQPDAPATTYAAG